MGMLKERGHRGQLCRVRTHHVYRPWPQDAEFAKYSLTGSYAARSLKYLK